MKQKLRNDDIHILPNGMKVLFVKNKKYKVSSISVMVNGGSIFEKEGVNDGYSHIVEHMLFQSSEKYSKIERHEDFSKLGASYNGGTMNSIVYYEIAAPSSNINLVFDRFYDMIFHPLFKKDEFQTEKGAILTERVSGIQKPSWKLNQLIKKNFYQLPNKKKHPYNNLIIGSEETIKNSTISKIKSFYQKFYQPSNMVFVIVGDKFDDNYILNKLLEIKNKINSSFMEELVEKKIKICKTTRYKTGLAVEELDDFPNLVKLEIESKTKKLIYHSLDRFNDYTTVFNEAMYNVFDRWFGDADSTLFKLFRNELGLVYSINGYAYSHRYLHGCTIETEVSINNLEDFFFNFNNFVNKDFKKYLPTKESFKNLIQNIKYEKDFQFYNAYNEARRLANNIIDEIPLISFEDKWKQLDKITYKSFLHFIDYHFNENEKFNCFIGAVGSKGIKSKLEKILNQYQFNSIDYFN